MTYVMDAGPLIVMFRHFYPGTFPTLWQNFDAMRQSGTLVSVREVSNEVDGAADRLSDWVKSNKTFFHQPTANELQIVTDIFRVRHFQSLIRQQERLKGKPVADPFVIAKAGSIENGCVLTEEKFRLNAATVPNVCDHFDIDHMNLEEFMHWQSF